METKMIEDPVKEETSEVLESEEIEDSAENVETTENEESEKEESTSDQQSGDSPAAKKKKKAKKKKRGLAFQFGLFFALFAVLTIIVSGMLTFLSQTESYHKECENKLSQLTTQLAWMASAEGTEFAQLTEYFKEDPSKVRLPLDIESDIAVSRQDFYDYVKSAYPNQTFGRDLDFEGLDEKGKELYAKWRFEYWYELFLQSADSFGLSYVYFVYPTEGKELYVTYMIDTTMGITQDSEGKDILFLGDEVYQDPKEHACLWEAWNSGKAPMGFDVSNNEYGYNYNYCMPLIIGGERIGLICADIDVYAVNDTIISMVARQIIVLILILVGATIIMYTLVRKRIIERIVKLESNVAAYAETKNPELAGKIRNTIERHDELGSLTGEFADMITELEGHMEILKEITAEKERIGAELNVATKIQASMLPRIFPPFPNRSDLDLYATMDPAKEVGGDFYDFFLIDDDHLALVMADVSGKGVPAALIMVIAKTLIKNHLQAGESVEEALCAASDQLLENNDEMLFVTAWVGIVNLKTGNVEFADAGHEPAFVIHKNGEVEQIKHKKKKPPLATIEGIKYLKDEFKLEFGDRLYLYTDGVPEATDATPELFGKERVMESLRKHWDKDSKGLLKAMRKEVDNFVGSAPQFDDMTMLAVMVREEG